MNQDLKQLAQLHNENIELKKEIERLKGEREWISINKFPKYRILPVLLFNGNAPNYNRHIFNGTWFSQTQKFIPDNKNHYFLGSITHWMPLPEPPKQ